MNAVNKGRGKPAAWSLVVGDQPCFLWDVVHLSRLECWGTAPQVCLPPGKCSPAGTEEGGAKAWPGHPATHSVLFTEPWLRVRGCSGREVKREWAVVLATTIGGGA